MQSPNPLFYGSSSGIRKSPSAIGKGADGPHVSSLNILGSPTHTGPAVVSSEEQLNVRGWLMNVPGYRQDGKGRDGKEDHDIMSRDNGLRDHDTLHLRRARSASINSISSNESVNLDELIKNNFTAQVDDETDLPNLADLDLDDSADDFWKLDNTASIVRPSLLQETWKNPLSIDHSHEHLSIDNSFDENEFLHLVGSWYHDQHTIFPVDIPAEKNRVRKMN
ncbi:hypothetical protein BX666DRAFT_1878744 [Dichotomocladium elegans]|nr:hypothetical protein BX666DRAFT_1878744 [Dichotomocladium elegans]